MPQAPADGRSHAGRPFCAPAGTRGGTRRFGLIPGCCGKKPNFSLIPGYFGQSSSLPLSSPPRIGRERLEGVAILHRITEMPVCRWARPLPAPNTRVPRNLRGSGLGFLSGRYAIRGLGSPVSRQSSPGDSRQFGPAAEATGSQSGVALADVSNMLYTSTCLFGATGLRDRTIEPGSFFFCRRLDCDFTVREGSQVT